MRLRFALGSWSNAHFEHTLYPLRTLHVERLPRYASLFDAVELDVLHHQRPEEGTLADWASQVPEGFTFLPKMHKEVTHGKADALPSGRGRKAVDAAEPDIAQRKKAATRFLADLGPLREAGVLGPVLMQFPPSLGRTEGWDLLTRILGLGEPGDFAVEFRHNSWFVGAVEQLLEDTETALVWSTVPKAFAPPWRTAGRGYVRFTGPHIETKGRHTTVADRLGDVLEVRKRLEQAGWDEAFVVVTNGFEGNAVDSIPRIAAALGEQTLARRLTRPPGGHLFPAPPA